MNLEFKQLEFEIKSIDEKGIFKGTASPFNNIDLGKDRALPSIAKRNNNKTVPYLWQHDIKEPVGEVKLITTKTGIDFEGKLYLETNEQGTLLIPNAHKAYVLMKNGILKNSIGYNTLEYKYVKVGSETVRDLIDIDIKEVSAVTFPMNPKANITSVKQEGGNKNMEEKAMGFADLLKVQQANDMRWKLQDALNCSFRQLMDDSEMDIKEKVAQLEANVDDFATAYKENMSMLLQASAKSKVAKKEVIDVLEKKEAEQLETKAGKKISKVNKDKLKAAVEAVNSLKDLFEDEEEEEPENEKTCDKKPGTKESSIEGENKQESNKDDTMELKSEELEELQSLYKKIKGDE